MCLTHSENIAEPARTRSICPRKNMALALGFQPLKPLAWGMQRPSLMASTLLEANTVARSTAAPTSNIVHFPSGLLGFEQQKKFALLGRAQEAPFLRLEAQDDSRVAFIVVPPKHVAPDYQPDISDEDVKFLGLKTPDEALVLGIVRLRRHGPDTINLKGPLVINARTHLAKQVVLVNATDYSTEYPLPAAS
jgi:flagellar assembly factor FliW